MIHKTVHNAGFQSRSTFLLGDVSNIDLQICKRGRCMFWQALPADFAHTKNMGSLLNCTIFAVYAAGPGPRPARYKAGPDPVFGEYLLHDLKLSAEGCSLISDEALGTWDNLWEKLYSCPTLASRYRQQTCVVADFR